MSTRSITAGGEADLLIILRGKLRFPCPLAHTIQRNVRYGTEEREFPFETGTFRKTQILVAADGTRSFIKIEFCRSPVLVYWIEVLDEKSGLRDGAVDHSKPRDS